MVKEIKAFKSIKIFTFMQSFNICKCEFFRCSLVLWHVFLLLSFNKKVDTKNYLSTFKM